MVRFTQVGVERGGLFSAQQTTNLSLPLGWLVEMKTCALA